MKMNLSIVASLNEVKRSKEEINEGFHSLCEFLKPLGYNGIELSLLKPEKIDVEALKELMDSYEMQVPALGTGGTYIRYGYSLGSEDRSKRMLAIGRLKEYINLAAEINSKVIIGLIRGRYNYQSNPKKEKLNIIESLNECLRYAEGKDVKLVFEPINRFEIDSYTTISNSLYLLEKLDSDHIELLIDSFHTHLEEDPGYIWDQLKDISTHVGHIHLADSNRRAPGTDHFDFRTFINIFKQNNYSGFYSLETIMEPSFEDVAKMGAEYLKYIDSIIE
jgi:sugar phosphate isomerase/epimerase